MDAKDLEIQELRRELNTLRERLSAINSVANIKGSISIKRAIEILNPNHREHYESIEPVNEACRMGMEALKKQIMHDLIFSGDGYDDEGQFCYDFAECPCCGHEFEEGSTDWGSCFCPDCGQALCWD